jgi:hypothetical protein
VSTSSAVEADTPKLDLGEEADTREYNHASQLSLSDDEVDRMTDLEN